MQAPLPLIVLGGFLGAGKTTLLNHVLSSPHGRRIGVVVNDFGDINIDEKLIAGQRDGIVSLANGCICCSIGNSFHDALFRIARLPDRPELLIIEASGVGDPGKIGQIGRVGRFFRLDATIVMVDAAHFRTHAADPAMSDTILCQIDAADRIVLNKIDLVSADDADALEAWLRAQNPGAALVRARDAQVDLSFVFTAIAPKATRTHIEGAPAAGDSFASVSFTSHLPFGRVRLEQVLGGLGEVVRGKGVLYVAEAPAHEIIFQRVAGESSLTAGAPWGDRVPRTDLVLIGIAGRLSRADAHAMLQTALAFTPGAPAPSAAPTLTQTIPVNDD